MTDLAKELGLAPVNRSKIEVVGTPDDKWAQENKLSAQELITYQELKTAWIPLLIKHYKPYISGTSYDVSSYQEFCLTTNRLAVPEANSSLTAYYIEFPAEALTNVIARSTPFDSNHAICFLTRDGFYFSKRKQELEKDNQVPIYFVHYTALGSKSVGILEEIGKAASFDPSWGLDSSDRETQERGQIPWDIRKVKKVAHERALQQRIAELQSLRKSSDFTFAHFRELYELSRQTGFSDTLLGQTLAYMGELKKLSSASAQTDFAADDLMFLIEKLKGYEHQLLQDESAKNLLSKVYLMAAEKGAAEAQYLYGKALLQGMGVKKDKEAALIWFKKAADQGHEIAARELPAVTEAEASTLMKKADTMKEETLSFKGFYLGMSEKDAWSVFHYHIGKPDDSGLSIQLDADGKVKRFSFTRTALDLIFKTKNVPFEGLVDQFAAAYKLRLDPGQAEVKVALEFVGIQQYWQCVAKKGFIITFYAKTNAFDAERLVAAGIANPDLITGQNPWESMVLEKTQVASF